MSSSVSSLNKNTSLRLDALKSIETMNEQSNDENNNDNNNNQHNKSSIGVKAKKVIMHCFCGKKSLVKRIRDNGWFFSVTTTVVRAQQFQELVKEVPLSQLFCETDTPFLSPYKDKLNEPAFIVESYKKIAEIKGMELKEVINNVYMNWQRVFE